VGALGLVLGSYDTSNAMRFIGNREIKCGYSRLLLGFCDPVT
jgi:hypothetical protein